MEGVLIIVKNVKEKDNYTRLVNRFNLVLESEIPTKEDLVCFFSRCTEKWMYLEKKTYEEFIRLKKDAFLLGYVIDTDSTYRTFQEQEDVMEEFIEQIGEETARKLVSIPGASEHHTGLAVDLVFYRNDRLIPYEEIKDTDPDYQWVVTHLANYGFILRYPKNSFEITGITYEPWHIRYVGKEVAIYMEKEKLLLEEYVSLKTKKKTRN